MKIKETNYSLCVGTIEIFKYLLKNVTPPQISSIIILSVTATAPVAMVRSYLHGYECWFDRCRQH